MTTIIDGKQLALRLKENIKSEVERMKADGKRQPCLAVILVGDDPASHSYVRGKIKACEFTGIAGRLIHLPTSISEQDLLAEINALNRDDSVHGVLVQLPLPAHINPDSVINAIAPEKDVDGFHPINVSKLWYGKPLLAPCTPKGILYILDQIGIDLDGKRAVVVGRSNIVGKPTAKLLLDRNMTVTLAHSHTKNLAQVTSQADVLVVAVGKKHCIGAEHIKQGAIVIDVGISRGDDGKLYGDVDTDAAINIASFITPVPGGVGPMTIAMLMQNTLIAYQNASL